VFSIAAIYAQIATNLSGNISGLGLLVSFYFIGRAGLEVPAGIFAGRVGPKKVAVLGGLLFSAAALLSSLAANLDLVIIARLVSGGAFGACFPQVMILFVRNLPKGSSGLGSGLVILMTTGVGAIFGLFGWAELSSAIGWRESLIVSGGLLLITTCVLARALEPDAAEVKQHVKPRLLLDFLLRKRLILLALALMGMGGVIVLVSNFIIYYLQSSLGLSAGLAGLVGAMNPAFSLVAPLAGRGFDRYHDTRRWIAFASLILAAGLAIVSIPHTTDAIVCVALVGVGQGVGMTITYASARETAESAGELEPIAVSWVDSISSIGPIVSAPIFSLIVLEYGYSWGWLFGSVFVLAFTSPLLLFSSGTFADSLAKRD
jgi:MFS family permease